MGFLVDTLASAPPATWAQMMQYYQPTPTHDPNSILATGTPPSAPTVDIPGIGKVQFHTSGQGQIYATRLNPDGTSTAFGPGTADPNGPIAQGTMANDGTFKQLFDALKYPAAGALAGYALSSMVGAGAAGATGASSAGYAEGWSGAAGVADPTMAAGAASGLSAVTGGMAAPGTTASTLANGLGTAANLGNLAQGIGGLVAGNKLANAASTAAANADPFASQRGQYAAPLATAISNQTTNPMGTYGSTFAQAAEAPININQQYATAASTASPVSSFAKTYSDQLNQLMANPTAVLPTTPGYEAAMQAVQRSGAAQGYTGSGNMQTALATAIGGQFYQQQLADLQSLTNMGTASSQQGVANLAGLNTAQMNAQQTRTANLSGLVNTSMGGTQTNVGNLMTASGANFNNAPAAAQIGQTGTTNAMGAYAGGLNSIVQGGVGLINSAGASAQPWAGGGSM